MTVRSPGEIAGYAKAAGFTGQNLVIAVAVALAESSGDDHATNVNRDGSVDRGLWQINSVHADLLRTGDVFNPADNARMAYSVWSGSGWKAWTVFNTGAYSRNLAAAQGAAGNPTAPSSSGADASTVAASSNVVEVGNPLFGAGGLVLPYAWGSLASPAQALANIGKLLSVPVGVIGWLTRPENITRIAKVIVGAGLVVGGIAIVAKPMWAPTVRELGSEAKSAVGTAAKVK